MHRTVPPLLLLLLGPAAAGAAEDDGIPRVVAPLRAGVLETLGRASFRHSPSDLGRPGEAFDGRPGTVLRSRAVNPAFLEVVLDRPRVVESAQAFFPGGARHEWSLLAGEGPERLEVIVRQSPVDRDAWSRVEVFHRPVEARVFRVVVKRLEGDDFVHFGEIALNARQRPETVAVEAASTVVTKGGPLPLRPRVVWDGGLRTTTLHGLQFETDRNGPLRLEPHAPHEPQGVMARYVRPGTAQVRAVLRGRGAVLESPPLVLEVEDAGRPDWSVTHLERRPRIPFDGPHGGRPEVGTAVEYRAHVKNYGTVDAPRVPCAWFVDGARAAASHLEGIPRFGEGTHDLRLPWTGTRREVRFVVDPGDLYPEASESNNERAVATDALLLGLWVERPLLTWFHRVQPGMGDGASGWEDWAQRQVARWNRMLAAAVHPTTPRGVTDRVALDRIVVVEEGRLPLNGGLPTNDPDSGDRTVDLMWGFPSTLLDGEFYRREGERSDGNPLWFEGSLLHELGHARYLVDLYRLDVHAREVALRGADGRPVAGTPAMPAGPDGRVHATASGRMMAADYAGGYGPHSAAALQRIAGRRARGGNRNPPPTLGEYLADLPSSVGVKVVDGEGNPLDGIRVRAWRRAPDEDGEMTFHGEPVRERVTREGGRIDLTDHGRDPFFEGRSEGPLDISRGLLVLEFSRGGRSAWGFLEVVPYNLAFWSGETGRHEEVFRVDLPR